MSSSKKLVLIDGHSLAYRAYHALPQDMRTSQGELTNAVFGFTSMLLTVLNEERPDYIAVTFDVGKTFRHDRYALYKANRPETPPEMSTQMARIREIIDAFKLPVFTVEGYEADDVLGTIAGLASATDLDTTIVTGDLDALQLVNDHVRVLTSDRRFSDTVVYDKQAVLERYGLSPRQLIDYKALVGDPSDNIPGVRGIGQKTATALLQKYGTLDAIYEHLHEISPNRVRNALEQGREDAFLSRDLARIVRDVPLQFDLATCTTPEIDRDRITGLFRELEFRTLLSRLPKTTGGEQPGGQLRMFGPEPGPAAPPAATAEKRAPGALGTYEVVRTQADLNNLVHTLAQTDGFAFDVETTSTDPFAARLVGLSVAHTMGEGYYIPVGHETGERQLPLGVVAQALGPLLADPRIPKFAHHAKYDITVLKRHGLEFDGLAFDTMIAEWLLDPSSHNLNLKNLAWARLGLEMTPISDLIGTGKTQASMAHIPIDRVAHYAGADADVTLRLVRHLEPELRDKALWPLFKDVEMPLLPVLMEMELKGVALDTAYLAGLSASLQERLYELEREIQQMVGHAFNIASTEQLSDALFITLGLPKQGLKKTKSGRYSTAAGVLENLRGAHPVIDLVLEHRQLTKLQTTYVNALPQMVNPDTGRLHTSFNQTGTVTGRLSSSEPNLQNIPIRTELGRQVRKAFIAEAGCRLLAADYSQIELRILAHVSEDEAMLEAFRRGEDIHASTAAAIFGVPLAAVTPEMRRVAKTTNFAISYGVTGFGLSQQTNLTPEEARQFIEQYFRQYPRVKAYIEQTKEKAAREGYVETLLGRRRYFPELQAGRGIAHSVRQSVERMAINAPIQGTAADIIKIAMIRLSEQLHTRGARSKMVLQVHDELVLEVPEAELHEVAPLVRSIMEQALELKAPLKADLKSGINWLDMKGIT